MRFWICLAGWQHAGPSRRKIAKHPIGGGVLCDWLATKQTSSEMTTTRLKRQEIRHCQVADMNSYETENTVASHRCAELGRTDRIIFDAVLYRMSARNRNQPPLVAAAKLPQIRNQVYDSCRPILCTASLAWCMSTNQVSWHDYKKALSLVTADSKMNYVEAGGGFSRFNSS